MDYRADLTSIVTVLFASLALGFVTSHVINFVLEIIRENF